MTKNARLLSKEKNDTSNLKVVIRHRKELNRSITCKKPPSKGFHGNKWVAEVCSSNWRYLYLLFWCSDAFLGMFLVKSMYSRGQSVVWFVEEVENKNDYLLRKSCDDITQKIVLNFFIMTLIYLLISIEITRSCSRKYAIK